MSFHTGKAGALLLITLSFCHIGSQAWASGLEAPNWDRKLATEAAEAVQVESAVNDAGVSLEGVKALSQRTDWSGPARDRAMLKFARSLSNHPKAAVPESVVEYVSNYQVNALVAHDETTEVGIPLYPVNAAMAGVKNQWRAEAAQEETVQLIQESPDLVFSHYLENNDLPYQRGARQAVMAMADSNQLALIEAGLPLIAEMPQLTGVLGTAALAQRNAEAFATIVAYGEGAEMVNLLRQATKVFDQAQLQNIEANSAEQASFETRAVMNALFAGAPIDSPVPLADGMIEFWTEEDGPLGLGYPVPIPVDTSTPFDGFRTYNGLHTRHQQLMNDTNIIHGEVVNQTFNGNNIWAYRIGDADRRTRDGLPEPATLTNGGIHAREWQTPEVVTGIMEVFAERQGDNHYYDFLLENVNMIVIPVQNVDGFMQTQRYPAQNFLGTSPDDLEDDPNPSPRDGRMRRKNMRGVDTILETEEDHLLGIDLNRNNGRFWATNPERSSGEPGSIVYHGEASASEPETQALLAAADLGPVSQLRLYNDVHSFSQVFYFHRTSNLGLNNHVVSLMNNMANFNAAIPNGTLYLFNPDPTFNIDAGFGMTHEYFADELEVAAFGIEVEPNPGGEFFNFEPGCGGNYGGLARNCHDGFILPESEIRRVREELSQSMTANFYQQAGPPSIAAVRFVDVATGAVVYEAEWDTVSDSERQLYVNQLMPLELGREYTQWIAYDRPMRWRNNGQTVAFPGQSSFTLNNTSGTFVDDNALNLTQTNQSWVNTPGGAPGGYHRYEDDVYARNVVFANDSANQNLVGSSAVANVRNGAFNMTGQALDSDPSTPISWANGGWAGWENDSGADSNTGGTDDSYFVEVSSDTQPEPFVVEPGTSAAWFDAANDGEGFMIEILDDNRAVMYWFTYDDQGEQAWYIAVGEVRGNRLIFDEVIRTVGGVFGPNFDPDTVVNTTVGDATFLYESCDTGTMVYNIDGRKGRFNLQRLSTLMGTNCGGTPGSIPASATRSGSWFNTDQSGHGFVVEVLSNGQALVYWFSYDLEGNQAWFFGIGSVNGDELTLTEVFVTSGPTFGPGFNPDDLELDNWGTLDFSLGCSAGDVTYDGTPAGYPAASLSLSRLSTLAGLGCD